jgi:hypothetical protein
MAGRLPYRLRQQSLRGEFGRSALKTRDMSQILQRATELSAQGMTLPIIIAALITILCSVAVWPDM